MTENQEQCLEKAKRYSKHNFRTLEFGRAYMRYIEDGYIPSHTFLNLVENSGNVIPMRKPKATPVPLNTYIKMYRKRLLETKG